MGFPRQDYWSGLPFPTPGNLPDTGIESESLCLLHWQADSLALCHLGSPLLAVLIDTASQSAFPDYLIGIQI